MVPFLEKPGLIDAARRESLKSAMSRAVQRLWLTEVRLFFVWFILPIVLALLPMLKNPNLMRIFPRFASSST